MKFIQIDIYFIKITDINHYKSDASNASNKSDASNASEQLYVTIINVNKLKGGELITNIIKHINIKIPIFEFKSKIITIKSVIFFMG